MPELQVRFAQPHGSSRSALGGASLEVPLPVAVPAKSSGTMGGGFTFLTCGVNPGLAFGVSLGEALTLPLPFASFLGSRAANGSELASDEGSSLISTMSVKVEVGLLADVVFLVCGETWSSDWSRDRFLLRDERRKGEYSSLLFILGLLASGGSDSSVLGRFLPLLLIGLLVGDGG